MRHDPSPRTGKSPSDFVNVPKDKCVFVFFAVGKNFTGRKADLFIRLR